ncbi:hypothetical protein LEN26_013040 [Aphanomyces euteiches]|nr:hypothetical protein LEN26_013040 [Aphanomyces euteiches]KAH9129878.1 hypothetical protein AeMF1_000144 [Aphanomyces euteiches]KAH9197630.1 hypothetical protein AeNC1_000425 [Aphanomyces euteiches]
MPTKRKQGDSMASILNGKMHKCADFVEAATIFSTLHKSSVTNLPKHFVVPIDAAYPARLHGMHLNTAQVRAYYKHGNLHPDAIAALQAIHFVFDVNEHKWQVKLAAFQTYKALYGDMKIQQDFVVPTDDPQWPLETWGMRLGLVVRSLRQKTHMPASRMRELEELGFVWNILEQSWEIKLQALQTYKAIYGNLLVPYSFKTPPESDGVWPKATCNLKLGHAVHNLRQNVGDMPAARRDLLNSIGFVWDCMELGWDIKVKALTTYKSLYGDIAVPYGFRIPRNDPLWPPETWDLRLGPAVHNIRQSGPEALAVDRRNQLDRLGFVWNVVEPSWDIKYAALQTFHRLFGHLDVPATFEIPKMDDQWPSHLWGMKLGAVVVALRHQRRQLDEECHARLDRLGFLWHASAESSPIAHSSNSPIENQDPWSLLLTALNVFRHLYGPSAVLHPDFVVPTMDPEWPAQTWDLQLGLWVDNSQSGRDKVPHDIQRQLEWLGFDVDGYSNNKRQVQPDGWPARQDRRTYSPDSTSSTSSTQDARRHIGGLPRLPELDRHAYQDRYDL